MTAGCSIWAVAPTPFFSDRGCHLRVLQWIRALQAGGASVRLFTYPSGRDLPGVETVRPFDAGGVSASVGPSLARPVWDAWLARLVARAARRERPDLLVGFLHEGAWIAARVGRRFGIPTLADLQGNLAGEMADHGWLPRGGPVRRWVAALERRVAGMADARTVAREGVAESGTVVPDAVDTGHFRPRGRDPELLRELGIPADAPLVVYLGLFKRYQGVSDMIDTVPAVLRERPDARFLLMGFPGERGLARRVRRLRLDGAVRILGRIPYEEAPRYLSLGHVAVAPKRSRAEGNGKLLAYLACGVPSVAYDLPVNRDLAGPHVRYADPAAPDGLARELLSALAAGGAPDRDARAWVEDCFSWTVVAPAIREVCATALGYAAPEDSEGWEARLSRAAG